MDQLRSWAKKMEPIGCTASSDAVVGAKTRIKTRVGHRKLTQAKFVAWIDRQTPAHSDFKARTHARRS
jgi:hypothetical protein